VPSVNTPSFPKRPGRVHPPRDAETGRGGCRPICSEGELGEFDPERPEPEARLSGGIALFYRLLRHVGPRNRPGPTSACARREPRDDRQALSEPIRSAPSKPNGNVVLKRSNMRCRSTRSVRSVQAKKLLAEAGYPERVRRGRPHFPCRRCTCHRGRMADQPASSRRRRHQTKMRTMSRARSSSRHSAAKKFRPVLLRHRQLWQCSIPMSAIRCPSAQPGMRVPRHR